MIYLYIYFILALFSLLFIFYKEYLNGVDFKVADIPSALICFFLWPIAVGLYLLDWYDEKKDTILFKGKPRK